MTNESIKVLLMIMLLAALRTTIFVTEARKTAAKVRISGASRLDDGAGLVGDGVAGSHVAADCHKTRILQTSNFALKKRPHDRGAPPAAV